MKNTPSTPDQPNAPHDWEAIARYLSGESSAAETERIARWLEEHPSDAELVAALDKAMTSLGLRDATDVDVESALQRVVARRDEPITHTERKISRRRPARRIRQTTVAPWRMITILAAAAVILFAARTVLQRKDGASSLPPLASGDSSRAFVTGVGKRDSVRLPDGGRVILGPASRLIVAASYGQPLREVELHGEAYFDVVHDIKHPFVVHVGTATIRDIGTSFAVRNDDGSRVQVVVTSGSVSVRSSMSKDSGAVLAAGDIGVVQSDGHVRAQHEAPTAQYLAWMRDSLVFREAPISEVSSGLRRWYGVTLRVDDTVLARRHLTMTFTGDSLGRVLKVIGLELGADVERKGDSAIVRPLTRSVRTK